MEKLKQVALYVHDDDFKLLLNASKLEKRSLSNFVKNCSLIEAKKVLDSEKVN